MSYRPPSLVLNFFRIASASSSLKGSLPNKHISIALVLCMLGIFIVSKGAKIRNRYNQVPHLTHVVFFFFFFFFFFFHKITQTNGAESFEMPIPEMEEFVFDDIIPVFTLLFSSPESKAECELLRSVHRLTSFMRRHYSSTISAKDISS